MLPLLLQIAPTQFGRVNSPERGLFDDRAAVRKDTYGSLRA